MRRTAVFCVVLALFGAVACRADPVEHAASPATVTEASVDPAPVEEPIVEQPVVPTETATEPLPADEPPAPASDPDDVSFRVLEGHLSFPPAWGELNEVRLIFTGAEPTTREHGADVTVALTLQDDGRRRGELRIPRMRYGRYYLNLHPLGARTPFHLVPSYGRLELDFGPPAVLEVTVLTADGESIPNATVSWESLGHGPPPPDAPRVRRSAASSALRIVTAPGSIRVTVSAPGFLTEEFDAKVVGGWTELRDVVLRPAAD